MKRRNILLFFSVLSTLCIWACGSMPVVPDPPEPEEEEGYDLDMVWESYAYPDTSEVLFSGRPVVHDGKIVYPGRKRTGHLYSVFVVDMKTGEQLKRIDYRKNPVQYLSVVDDYLVASCFDGIFVHDLNTFALVQHIGPFYESRHTMYDRDIYAMKNYGDFPWLDSCSIVRINIDDWTVDELYTVTLKEDGGTSNFTNISVEEISGSRIHYGVIEAHPRYVYAYSEGSNGYKWRTELDPYENDNYYDSPVIGEKYVYIIDFHKVQAYDKETGELGWSMLLENNYRGKRPLLIDGKLYCISNYKHLYCLDALTGELLYHRDDTMLNGASSLWSTDGINFYESESGFGNLGVYRISDGELIYKLMGPHHEIDLDDLEASRKLFGAFAKAAPIVDRAKGLIYLADYKRMYCFKMHDTW